MKNDRKHYSAEEKVAILRRHLLDKVPVSTLCEELNLQPKVATATIPPVKCPHCPQPREPMWIYWFIRRSELRT